jgi:hypothetical protein
MGIHVAEAVDGEDGISEYTMFRPGLGMSRIATLTNCYPNLPQTLSIARYKHAPQEWVRGCYRHPVLRTGDEVASMQDHCGHSITGAIKRTSGTDRVGNG